MTSSKAKRKRKRLTRRRMAELPNFDVEEILGEFELDQNGNSIILQTANGKLNDKYGRLVNRRGYLVDMEGNVVTRGNVFIFYKEEIDFDDEVPAPYCFQKAKNVKYMVKNFSAHRQMRRKEANRQAVRIFKLLLDMTETDTMTYLLILLCFQHTPYYNTNTFEALQTYPRFISRLVCLN